MTTEEIQRLIVRLEGQGFGDYSHLLKKAEDQTVETAKVVRQSAEQVERFGTSLRTFASGVVASVAALGTARFLSGARAAYEDAEKVSIRLSAAIENNKGNVEETTATYRKFAEAVAATTAVSKAETTGLLAQAEARGLTGRAAQAAVKDAISLSALTGQGTRASLFATISASAGNLQPIQRMLKELRGVKDPVELAAKAQEKLNAGWKLAEALGQTNSAQIARFGQAFNDLRKEVGGLLSNALTPLLSVVRQVVNWFKDLEEGTRRVIVTVGALVGAFLLLRGPIGFVVGVVATLVTSLIVGFAQLAVSLLVVTPMLAAQAVAWSAVTLVVSVFRGAMVGYLATLATWRVVTAAATVANLAWVAVMALVYTVTGIAIAGVALWNSALTVGRAIMAAYTVATALFNITMNAAALTSKSLIFALIAAQAGAVAFGAVMSVVGAAVTLATGAVGLLVSALTAPVFVASVITLVAMSAALLTFYTGVKSVVLAGQEMAATFGSLGEGFGKFLDPVVDIFKEWWTIINQVAQTAKVDLPGAWRLAQAGFALAWEQSKDVLRVFWKFLVEGFSAAFDATFAVVKLEWKKMIRDFQYDMKLLNPFADVDSIETQRAESQNILNEEIEAAKETAAEKIQIATEEINLVESIETKQARDDLKTIQEELRKSIPNFDKSAFDVGSSIGKALGKGFHDNNKFTAALYGSADALIAIANYKDRLEDKGGTPVALDPTGRGRLPNLNVAGEGDRWLKQEALLQQIRDAILSKSKQGGPAVTAADLDDEGGGGDWSSGENW